MNYFAKISIVALYIFSFCFSLKGMNYNQPKFFDFNEISKHNLNSVGLFSDGKFIVKFYKDKIDFEVIDSSQDDDNMNNFLKNILSIKFIKAPTCEIENNYSKLNIYSGKYVQTNISSIKSITYNFQDELSLKFIYENSLKLVVELLPNFKKLDDLKIFEISSDETFEIKNNSIQIKNINGMFSINLPDYLRINNENGFNEVSFSDNLLDKKSGTDILLNNYEQKIDYCTYNGGSGNDWIMSIAVDDDSNMFITGITTSYDIPIKSGKIDSIFKGNNDIYILKIDKNKKLIWSTYWGGNNRDYAYNIKLDSKGNIWVGGDSESGNIFTTNDSYQKNLHGYADGLIGKLDKNGVILYASFLGGNNYDSFTIFDIDKKDNIWLSGRTTSSNFPLTNDAYQKNNNGDYETFLVKMSNDGKLLYSSYFGSVGSDIMEGFYVTEDFNIIQSGFTNSSSFPVIKTKSPIYAGGDFDSFIVKYDLTGQPIWSRFYGGTGTDMSRNLITDNKGNIYVTGYTNSTDLPYTNGAFQSKNNGLLDVFITKFDSNGNLIKSTYFGGLGNEGSFAGNAQWGGICIDKNYEIYLSGFSESTDLWTSPSTIYSKNQGLTDQFILKFDEELNPLWATYFGGKSNDFGKDIIRLNNSIYSVGWTQSDNLPITSNSYQNKYNSAVDGYILEINNDCNNFFSLNSVKNFGMLAFVDNAFAKKDKIILTNGMNYQKGSVWNNLQFSVNQSFETSFSFRMYNPKFEVNSPDTPFPGADGIAFVIQNSSHKAIGGHGGRIGYAGIPNSIAVEFDMYYNGSETEFNDPNGNHVAIMSNGKNANSAFHNSISTLAINDDVVPMKPDSTIYYSKIVYDSDSQFFSVYLDTINTFSIPILSKSIDLSKMIDLTKGEFAWLGFTSATAEDYMTHEIMSWDICSNGSYDLLADVKYNEIDVNKYSVYPNPTNSSIKIENIQFAAKSNLILTDNLGRSINLKNRYNYDSNSLLIDLTDYNTGIYYLTISDNLDSITIKLIKF
jgi:hypothetical protein